MSATSKTPLEPLDSLDFDTQLQAEKVVAGLMQGMQSMYLGATFALTHLKEGDVAETKRILNEVIDFSAQITVSVFSEAEVDLTPEAVREVADRNIASLNKVRERVN